MECLKHQFKINLGYEDVDVVKAKVIIEECPNDNPIKLPGDEKEYTVKFVSEDGDLVADRNEISYAVWKSIKDGKLKDGDWVGVETDCITKVFDDSADKQIDESWTPIFSEALATLYSKIKKDKAGRVSIYDLKTEIKHLEKEGYINLGEGAQLQESYELQKAIAKAKGEIDV